MNKLVLWSFLVLVVLAVSSFAAPADDHKAQLMELKELLKPEDDDLKTAESRKYGYGSSHSGEFRPHRGHGYGGYGGYGGGYGGFGFGYGGHGRGSFSGSFEG